MVQLRFKAEQTEHLQAFLDTVHAQLNTYTRPHTKLLADMKYQETSPEDSMKGIVVVLLNKFGKNKFKEENKAWYVKPLSPARTHTHTHTHTHTRS